MLYADSEMRSEDAPTFLAAKSKSLALFDPSERAVLKNLYSSVVSGLTGSLQ